MIPTSVQPCITCLQAEYLSILADNLRGIYVHGSIALACFNPERSDIDVLVIVDEPLNLETKRRLGRFHLRLSDACSNTFELSVVLKTFLDNFVYPTPFEFHYGDSHKEAFANDTVDLITPRNDPDLAAHFVITKHAGIALYGASAQAVFPDVPRKDYLGSIFIDAEWSYNNILAGPDEGVCRVPVYAVTNFCRVLAFIEDGLITSKQSGAEWALEHLSDAYVDVIRQALNEYTQMGSSTPVDCRTLKDFAKHAYETIKANL